MAGQQQQPNQMQPNQQQMPDHRLDEILDMNKQLLAQNEQLRQYINQAVKPQQSPQQPGSQFKPEVEQELQRIIDARFAPLKQQYDQQVGMLYDRTDELNFQTRYGGDDRYQKLLPQVDKIRQEQQRMGRWVSREDALKMVYFEEHGKKAQPAPQAQQAQPVWSPYFGTFVDPITQLPVPQQTPSAPTEDGQQPPNQMAPQGQQAPAQTPAWQQPVPQQQPQQQQAYQPAPQGYGRPQGPPQSNHPYGNAFGQPVLPQQGVPPQGQMPAPAQGAPKDISLESSDADLAAFESKFGDIQF